MTLLQDTHPHLAAQWDAENNEKLDLSKISTGSNKRAAWKCEKGHTWEATVNNRTSLNRNCPYCTKQRPIPNETSFAAVNPTAAAQWHPTLNGTLTPEQVFPTTNKLVWWRCTQKHTWQKSVRNHHQSLSSCPECETLPNRHPNLAAEWSTLNPEPFNTQDRYDITPKTWECLRGHTWKQSIRSRIQHQSSCPTCKKMQTIPARNLKTTQPAVAAQWDYTKNHPYIPENYTPASNKKMGWKCEKGHTWEAQINSRSKGSGCPVCAGKKPWLTLNTLQDVNPDLAATWHPTKNSNITPSHITANTHEKFWWKCEKEHEWEATPHDRNRANKGTDCPNCYSATSRPEQTILEFIQKLNITAELHNRTALPNKQEIDIYIPTHKLGIEYNGLYWHTEESGKPHNYHYDKWAAAKKAGIQLIQIWEDDWEKNPEIILRAIAHKLGATQKLNTDNPELHNQTRNIYARQTVITQTTTHEVQTFLNQNHIQGFASGTHYITLQHNNQTVAAMVLKKEPNNTLNIIRYATQGTIVGGFTKLLKHATKTHQPDKIITFADHCISDGKLYENNGFTKEKELPPDYMYVVNKQRKHKFGYRLKKFQTDPNLKWVEGHTEHQLAQLNNLPRIWDAGKTKYVHTPAKNSTPPTNLDTIDNSKKKERRK